MFLVQSQHTNPSGTWSSKSPRCSMPFLIVMCCSMLLLRHNLWCKVYLLYPFLPFLDLSGLPLQNSFLQMMHLFVTSFISMFLAFRIWWTKIADSRGAGTRVAVAAYSFPPSVYPSSVVSANLKSMQNIILYPVRNKQW